MARIPDDELARLKRDVDLVALVRASGVELSACGADLRGRCCFHEGDETPSLVITPKGPQGWPLFHCFGCNAGGDAIRWVELTQHVSFRHAVEILRGTNGTPVAPVDLPRGKRATPLNSALPVALDATDQQLLNQVIDYYSLTLKTTVEAREYLAKRGLVCAEMVETFRLGYANNTLTYRLPKKTWREGRDVRARLTTLGIIREATGHEHLAGSLVIPILDERGNVQGAYGRKITAGLRAGTPLHLYLRGPHRGVWNVAALAASKEVILAEALIDALTWWAHGFRNVTTSYGVSGFTDDILTAFKRHGVEKVYVAYDRDDAGDRAADELAPRLAEAGMDVYRVLFPRAKEQKDANGYAQSAESPVEALGVLLRSAQFVAKGKRTTAVPPAPSAVPSVERPVPAGGQEDSAQLHDRIRRAVPMADAHVHDESAAAIAPDGQHGDVDSGTAQLHDRSRTTDPAAVERLHEGPDVESVGAAPAEPSLVVRGDQADLAIGDRSYRVGNLAKNLSPNAMRVTLRVARGERVHVDTLELLSARARELFVRQAAVEIAVEPETVKKDIGKLLLALEELQAQRIESALEAKPTGVVIPPDEKEAAFAFLKDPRLLDRVVEDLDRVGLVGERTNKLTAYLATTSRKLAEPLAVLVQSNSAAGKSALVDAVLELVPPEDVERYTAMTGQSLYYLADTSLRHKVLAIAEVAGAEKAGYALRCLQTDGKISIATTVKDAESGEMRTKRHEVEGPVAIFLTTTDAEIDEELQNRAIVLTVNEDREQTRAIHEAQRRSQTLEGILAREERQAVIALHRNAQRLLRPLRVVNAFASRLTFPDAKLRTRRDHAKYLNLIRAVALLHQYQRPIRQAHQGGREVTYIEATISDIEVANRLANEVLGRSLDEMAPQTRRLLLLLDEMVTARCRERRIDRQDCRFTRREVREHTQWSERTVRKHVDRLVDLEYVVVHRGGRGQRFVLELVYDGQGRDGGRFVVGLIDTAKLRGAGTTSTSPTPEPHLVPPKYPQSTPFVRGSCGGGNGSG